MNKFNLFVYNIFASFLLSLFLKVTTSLVFLSYIKRVAMVYSAVVHQMERHVLVRLFLFKKEVPPHSHAKEIAIIQSFSKKKMYKKCAKNKFCSQYMSILCFLIHLWPRISARIFLENPKIPFFRLLTSLPKHFLKNILETPVLDNILFHAALKLDIFNGTPTLKRTLSLPDRARPAIDP